MNTRQDSLLPPAERLEAALAAQSPGREHDWATEVDRLLGGVEEVLRRHAVDTDAAGGMFTKVDLTRPTLVRQVSELRQEHVSLLERADALRQETRAAARAFGPEAPDAGSARLPAPATPAVVPDFGSLRGKLGEFAAALRRHRDAEAGLVQESVTTDIGVGD